MISIAIGALSGFGLYVVYLQQLIDERIAFIGYTLLLLVFLAFSVRRARARFPDRWMLNPVVAASFGTFVLGYGATNYLYFLPPDEVEMLGFVPEVSPAMVKHIALVFLAALAMWAGYWSPVGKFFVQSRGLRGLATLIQNRSQKPRDFIIPGMVAISTICRIVAVQQGVFGYSSSYDRLIEAASFTMYLSMGAGLGSGALLLLAFRTFGAQNTPRRGRLGLMVLLTLEVVWGFMSGFKGQVIVPFVMVAVAQYLVRGRVDRKWILFGATGLVVAYAVIEPFRYLRNHNPDFRGTDVIEIAGALLSARGSVDRSDLRDVSFILSVSARSNLTWVGSFGIELADRGPLDEYAPKFLEDLLLAPIHAIVPRFLWDGKSLFNIGLWYHQDVMGKSTVSSDAMGPVTYLYFAGGTVAVFLGFFFIGVIQRTVFFAIRPWASAPGAFFFLGFLYSLSFIDSSFNGIILNLIRFFPLYVLGMMVVFPRASAALKRW